MTKTTFLSMLCAALALSATTLSAQNRGGLSLSVGFTESEKPVFAVSYFHRVASPKIYAVGGMGFFNPGAQVSESLDPDVYFASVTQAFAGVQLGDVLFVAPRISYNWYGPYRSTGWGVSGGFAFRIGGRISLGLVAAHDRLRFDDAVDAYGPSPYTSLSLLANFWFVR